MKTLLLLGALVLASSCEKDKEQYNLKGFEYPEGISVVDLTGENDCNLPKCSDQRVRRLKAKGTKGIPVDDSTISVSFMNDGYILLRLCEKMDGKYLDTSDSKIPWVIFSGDLHDACGILEYKWPIAESYIMKLTNIKKL